MLDLVVHGDELTIGIEDGRFVAPGPAREEIDARGLLLLPGGVDPHVHFNEPGHRSDWEGWETGSAALAAGGFTTVAEMPLNASPPTVTVAAFDAKVAAASAVSCVDFALWGGIVPGNLGEMAGLAERGVIGFKAFMSDSGADDFPRADDLTLYEGMCEAAALGLPVAVHAESEAITTALRERATGTGMTDWAASRPVVAETEAIARAIELAASAGCSLHLVHVSSARGVALCAAAGVSCEVTAHHLTLDDVDAAELGAVAKCAPPLRPRAEVDALWEAVRRGDVTSIVSDHSPSPPELRDEDDLFASWGGIGGGQSTLELVAGELPPPALASLLADGAARRFGLASKGRLEPGFDADLVLVRRESYTLTAGRLRSRHRVSPYVGRTMGARVVRTLLRGGAPTAGRGRLIRPA